MSGEAIEINAPEVVAELRAIYPLYEAALVTNDVDTLVAFFWDSPLATRFGVMENLHGFAEIASFRKGRSGTNLARTIHRLDIVAFGQNCAQINLEFAREAEGQRVLGRQSQTWVRFAEGWRIISAHISLLP
jgi:hypothetical protein